MGDLKFDAKARTFTAVFSRYRWEAGANGKGERVRSALQLGSVLSVKAQRLKHGATGRVRLPAVAYLRAGYQHAGKHPAARSSSPLPVGGAMRLEVECVDLGAGPILRSVEGFCPS